MKKFETFSHKTKCEVIESQNGYCLERDCLNKIHSIHHKLPNKKANRIKFPLFIHSPFNAAGLCQNCHSNKSGKHKITEKQAAMYERFLNELKYERG